MGKYIGKRTLTGLLCIVMALCINFIIIHAAPGDPIRLLAGTDTATPEMIEALTQKYGLDQPVHIQFIRYVGNLLKGDMGTSIYTNEPVAKEIMNRLGPTVLLALSARLDMALGSVSYLFDSTPSFWLGLMLILIFASTLHILPTSGMVDLRSRHTGFAYVLDVLRHLILPGMSLSLTLIPYYFRIARSSVIQVMNEDFITTAGLSDYRRVHCGDCLCLAGSGQLYDDGHFPPGLSAADGDLSDYEHLRGGHDDRGGRALFGVGPPHQPRDGTLRRGTI